ncbi:MAG: hypothetical protein R3325_01565 [Thermoanaerobaculia bacterium]|nr:hypothetical protein [Thermoanaerobaculia bacterium]
MKTAGQLNLASRPFRNDRPLTRLALLLWVVVAVLTLVNGFVYYRHFAGSRLTGEQQAELRRQIAEEEERLGELREALAELSVARTNERARYLNALIVERAFSWSRLFDRLAEALPANVRLAALVPNFATRGRSARRVSSRTLDDEVILEIRGTARTDTALLEFVDRLFAHPSFLGPNLRSERLNEGGGYDFTLNVVYHPTASEGEPAPEEPSPAGDDEPATPAAPGGGEDQGAAAASSTAEEDD